jgi:hypothetical protein
MLSARQRRWIDMVSLSAAMALILGVTLFA